MQKVYLVLAIMIFTILINGCSKTYTIEIHEKKIHSKSEKRLALFLDGTANSMKSRTNISKLYEIIANQNKDNLYLFYNSGVGTGGKFLGAMVGLGIDKDVKEAYKFLSDNYTEKSKLSIFGFSRGAYTARILAGMIYTVGIYDLNDFKNKKKIINELYSQAYEGKNRNKKTIRTKANAIIEKWKNIESVNKTIKPYENVKIDILGLWDTVEALGFIPTIEAIENKILNKKDKQNIVNPNNRYFDQICNTKKVFQALALDDNRADVFTPIILAHNYFKEKCNNPKKPNVSNIVDEVWFSGAHADIGGGYNKNNSLSGVSLNWMISKIKEADSNLLPKDTKVYENRLGYIHNAEKSLKIAYKEENRSKILKKYIDISVYKKLRIHQSVIDGLKSKNTKKDHDSKWYLAPLFKACFTQRKNQTIKIHTDNELCKKVLKVVP